VLALLKYCGIDEARGNVVADVDCEKIWLVLSKGARSIIMEN
jgi:hypothetical protein